ncbi:centrosomal protein of 85 kDa-like [Sphaeramia orbicularis]|uniref:centrosomal protein of 85 kDa-like n=1 Tax=Sphaeramia orbicularis TaxID=375764 RepID=UPI00117D7198|nr:centrosomal protein of 85 kDa-like [Sphaeramia orbicularis]
MWYRDLEDGYESNKTGSSSGGSPGWVPGQESAWQSTPPVPGSFRCGRRHSTVSDSGDTGIGTYCSDSVEDDPSYSNTPSAFQPLLQYPLVREEALVHMRPAPSSLTSSSGRLPASPSSVGHLLGSSMSLGSENSLDMKDHQPIRRWSSLNKLSSGADKSSTRAWTYQYHPDSQGSLDRGLLQGRRRDPQGSSTDLYLPLSSSFLCNSLLQRSPGAGPCYRYNHNRKSTGLDTHLSVSSGLVSPIKHNCLDMIHNGPLEARLLEVGEQVYGLGFPKQPQLGSPIQPEIRTKMWLTEQMEYSPKVDQGGDGGHGGPSGTVETDEDGVHWQLGNQHKSDLNQTLMETALPVNALVKVKEGLLRQRELEIDRQKQQILQLHARIRENELRAQQVMQSQKGWFDNHYVLNTKDSAVGMPRKQLSDSLQYDEELGRKLAVAELEVHHLNEFFKQVTQKYTEGIRKLEEKIRTRDRYITSLKKKCQRESEQKQEKQQRIETLEKYLADLPTLNEVQAQAQKLEEVQLKAKDMEDTMSRLQKSAEHACALMKEKNVKIELQAKREQELIASVHSLQQKVQLCLADGVRLPVLDLKQLEVENTRLLEQQDYSSKLIHHQKEQIEKLMLQLTQRQMEERLLVHPPSTAEMQELGQLLKEMSLCLLDLQALCSIQAQRAEGKEPNLSLLLGMKSLSVSVEENECRVVVEQELRFKLMEVTQLRKDIDELRKSIKDCSAQR